LGMILVFTSIRLIGHHPEATHIHQLNKVLFKSSCSFPFSTH
jgi:hypothetical protein